MLKRFFRKDEEPSKIDEQIDAVLGQMTYVTPAHEDYEDLLDQYERLMKLKTQERPQRISRDVLFAGGIQFLCVVVILGFEQRHVLTTKTFGLIPKMKT